MGSTLEQISEYLNSENLQHRMIRQRCYHYGLTLKYLDQDGEHHCKLSFCWKRKDVFQGFYTTLLFSIG